MVDDADKSWTLVAAKDCKVKVNDTDSKLEDLQAGDEITVDLREGRRQADRPVDPGDPQVGRARSLSPGVGMDPTGEPPCGPRTPFRN